MKVSIKDFAISLEVKNNGVEFKIHDNGGRHKGDCYVTKTGLIWCEGKTTRQNGKRISWEKFMELASK